MKSNKTNLTENWTLKMHVKFFITGLVGRFNSKASWYVARKLFSKEELDIIGIDLNFLD
jgi:hypothetical protein